MAYESSNNANMPSNWQSQMAYQSLIKTSYASPNDQTSEQIRTELEDVFSNMWNPMESWLERYTDAPVANPAPQEHPLLVNTEVQQLLENPEQLLDGAIDIPADELRKSYSIAYPNGRLSDQSKDGVNQLISQISKTLDREVHASVYFPEQSSAQIRLTAGSKSRVEYTIEENTAYSAHTHLSGILKATPTDKRYEVAGAEDAVVVDGEGLIFA